MNLFKSGKIKFFNKLKPEFEFLKDVKFLKGLSTGELKQFSKLLHERKFKENEIIFKKGYPHAVLYIVGSGELKVILERDDSAVINLATVKKSDHFGEIGLFTESNRTATVIGKTDSVLYAVSKSDFTDFINIYPKISIKILYNISKSLCDKISKTNDKLK
ncbi:MAG: hypothetical protein CSB55_04610 [Candidatus Cloacimonadota bacterium]|nr:MAG: hypothetical protein CSB55_04610 [Candidatus Cloacimonadota bacterium]